ncbi:B12-binding domain-containing radical SAM protein [Desulfoplanes sp. PS50]
MKVLLLTPPAPRLRDPATMQEDLLPPKTWVPLGIAYLTSALRIHNVPTHYQDLHEATWSDIAVLLRSEQPDVVGISCFTLGRINAHHLATMSRQELPDAHIVMGGPHATFYPEHMLENPAVDMVVMGEGEATIVELVTCLEEGRPLAGVRGLALRTKDGTVRTPPREEPTDLDGLAFPAYDSFDLAQYKSPEIPEQFLSQPGTHLLTSRGCPFHCGFCSVNRFFEGRWARRSPRNVVDEIEELTDRLHVQHLYFSDDLFTLDRKRVIDLCREILDRKIFFAWMAETRVDLVDKEMLELMRQTGCYRIYYGVESGSPRILKAAGKGFTVEHVRKAFAMTHQAGIEPCCFLMVGNPGENPETIKETVELINEIRPAIRPILGINTLFPASPQYDYAKEQGVIADEYWRTDAPPPPYTVEHDVDDLIYLQMLLTRGVAPEVYERMCEMGFDEKYFIMRRMVKGMAPSS